MSNNNYSNLNLSGMNLFNKVSYKNNNLCNKLIEENQQALIKAYEYQNIDNFQESVVCLESIAKNFHILGLMADQFAYTPEVIQENREMLSQAHLDSIIDNFPSMELNKSLYTSHTKPKEKQIKKPWTENEQKLFLEGIEKFGMKSK